MLTDDDAISIQNNKEVFAYATDNDQIISHAKLFINGWWLIMSGSRQSFILRYHGSFVDFFVQYLRMKASNFPDLKKLAIEKYNLNFGSNQPKIEPNTFKPYRAVSWGVHFVFLPFKSVSPNRGWKDNSLVLSWYRLESVCIIYITHGGLNKYGVGMTNIYW